ncbi:type I polyketide synthase [Roseofilum casamattae]|uniref:Type I polyketide synthase n=1 Tax=Roseofilum casamattae BLCC-M143 TaxID=3022442 RepID=A0ABT7BVZ8_9CYAN|nr:type I polyketide synthase [Roseofilum casamattae]MDJ1183275.1 type I polyketide synthase [Roseofilum casamattae BLCC-M143]
MESRKHKGNSGIAVVGMSCRFPGAKNYSQFWKNLEEGVNSIGEIPQQRWSIDRYYSPTPQDPHKTISKWGGFVEGVDRFDAQFFNISPREAEKIDPQHRIMLELSWSCLEDAGYAPKQLSGEPVGVFIGVCNYDYDTLQHKTDENTNGHSGTGTWVCMLPNRISSFFNFHGPSIPVDAACSSSLVAVHQAIDAIANKECHVALVGGVSVCSSPTRYIQMSQLGMLSPTGQCKTFDKDADGYVRGEGAGVILLKSVEQAVADGDRIYGIIRGSAINHGGRARTLTSPNVYAQAQVLRSAYTRANIPPDTVSYIEAHGTGTPLGDPIEINALKRGFRQLHQQYGLSKEKQAYCGLGAVKSNIGHLEGAAGIAGLIKILLAVHHKKLPKLVNFNGLNPRIKLKDSPFYIIEKTRKWKRLRTDSGKKIPRRAGVSSFGIGGVNAHVIVEEVPSRYRKRSQTLSSTGVHPFTISAQTPEALRDLVTDCYDRLVSESQLSLCDACYTAATGRSHQFAERLAIAVESKVELQEKLADILKQRDRASLPGISRGKAEQAKGNIAFLFTGQGAQYAEMGRSLYESQPIFQQALEQCNEILNDYLDLPLLDVLYDENCWDKLDRTQYTQPAIFAIEYALYKLWESWGIKPNWVMGHSVGEYAAACVAGIFSLEDGLKLIAMRGRLMQKLPAGGEMVSLLATEAQVREALAEAKVEDRVNIAAFNGPNSIVISGEHNAIATVVEKLKAQGIKTKQLQVSHAFHSPLMEPMLAEFKAVAEEINYSQPQITLISNVTGQPITEEIANADYWVRHIRQPVYFAQSIEALHQQGCDRFLEVGPKPILLGMGRQCLPEGAGIWLPSLRPNVEDERQMFSSLGELYVGGTPIDWQGVYQDRQYQKIALPTYPFQRQRYWIDAEVVAETPVLTNAKTLHPLLGSKLQLAGVDRQQHFNAYISETAPVYLTDHRVFDRALFPATGYLEMAIAAAKHQFNAACVGVENVTIRQGLILPEAEVKQLQTIITPIDNRRYKFEIYSAPAESDDPAWTLHTEGKLKAVPADSDEDGSLEAYRAECQAAITAEDHYASYREIGIEYGDSFQGVVELATGREKVVARIELPEDLRADLKDYYIHPALLDAAFQAIGQALENKAPGMTYLPIGIEQLALYHHPGAAVWAVAHIDSATLKGDITLVDASGTVLVAVQGLSLVATTASALLRTLQPGLKDWYYQIDWKPAALETTAESEPGTWLVFAQNSQLADAIEKALKPKQQKCIWISAGKKYRKFKTPHYQINPTCAEHYEQLLADCSEISGIVHLWGRDEDSSGAPDLAKAVDLSCGSILHLVQALGKASLERQPDLWLVTQGTQNVTDPTEVIQPHYGTLWGLGRTIALEQAQLNCRRIDLDPQAPIKSSLPKLVEELLSPTEEDQIAIRQDTRYVARLGQCFGSAQHKQSGRKAAETNIPVQLKLEEYGSIDNIGWKPLQRRSPGAGEVEIEVKAVGLNFRDVLNALGMLQEYYAEHLGITRADQLTFGFECAGTIAAVGEGVTKWQIGDRVMATLLNDGFSSFLTVPATRVMPQPETMNATQAATLPLTFLTAYYGLQELAKIQAGDRVLIHSAAGGVGQAAVQIAQAAGAEVFATASPGKWDFLKSLGIKHIMNSRTLDFATQVMTDTQGKGVDIVLNSLNGDFIDKSLEVLATNGRFVEIGKIGIWTAEEVAEKRPDAAYFPFDLGEVADAQPDIVTQLGDRLAVDWNQGTLNALPHKIFASSDIQEAFRYMQQAKHIGKVVISMPVSQNEVTITSDATYLITGGLGALGLEIAQWLVEQGARSLMLTSRRSPSETAQTKIAQLEATGASVQVVAADISQEKAVSNLMQTLPQDNGKGSLPLKGIIHAAGVLDDALLQNMSWQQFTKVLAPKMNGTWYLHQHSQHLSLDFFVCFSSIASMLGSAGQGNYAAANGFMDAMANYRQGLGLPALTLNWGPWGQVGMAANLTEEHQHRLEASGLKAIAPEDGMQALGELLSGSSGQVGVFPVKWSAFLQQVPERSQVSFLENFSSSIAAEDIAIDNSADEDEKGDRLLDEIQAAPSEERDALLLVHLSEKISHLLGMKDGQIDREKPLTMMGLDSLMAVELRNLLQRELEVDIAIPQLIEGISVLEITDLVSQKILLDQISSVDDSATEDIHEDDMEEITL